MNINEKSSLRKRADTIKEFRCKNLIVVLENPSYIQNLATTIRNVNALGVEKLYLVDSGGGGLFPQTWHTMREQNHYLKLLLLLLSGKSIP